MTELIGRRAECGTLGRLVAEVRARESRALVVHGEPGVGNTVLLDYLVGQAPDCRLVRAPAFSTLTAAINDAGVVVGEWFDANATFHGFSASHGVFTPIEDPAGTESTHVDGISNRGVIVGFSVDSSGNFHGFELSPAR
ncbi:MAG TPA: ATP-binding protein [Streptosporangiaceae bacterium]|nr:ATP-binding protein [Streptosporangiaceae bacterium]